MGFEGSGFEVVYSRRVFRRKPGTRSLEWVCGFAVLWTSPKRVLFGESAENGRMPFEADDGQRCSRTCLTRTSSSFGMSLVVIVRHCHCPALSVIVRNGLIRLRLIRPFLY